MEENSSPVKQSKSNTPVPSRANLLKFCFAVIVLLLLLGILNYFNILPIFRIFPKQQIQQKNTISSQGNTDLCRPFSSVNISVKITCQKAMETALADTQGKPIKIGFGPLQLEPALIKTLERQKITIPKTSAWIIEIVLDKPIILQGGKKAISQRIQIPADGTRAIYRTPISL
jgi:cell division septal protein FtsQ